MAQWQRFIQLAREAREEDNTDLRQARNTVALLGHGELPLAGYVAHYTFDFMQSLAVPQFADQPKDLYFFRSATFIASVFGMMAPRSSIIICMTKARAARGRIMSCPCCSIFWVTFSNPLRILWLTIQRREPSYCQRFLSAKRSFPPRARFYAGRRESASLLYSRGCPCIRTTAPCLLQRSAYRSEF